MVINPELENSPSYIQDAIDAGFDVEIDVWYIDDQWFLGHDEPQYKVDNKFLVSRRNKLWCHAKNTDALFHMIRLGVIHCFYHQSDDVVLTSRNYLWTFPGRQLTKISIAVLPEQTDWTMEDLAECSGICSDYISKYIVTEGK